MMSGTASHIQCLCGAVRESASLLVSTDLPLKSDLCHCDSCRHTSGALYCACVKLTSRPTSLGACTRYSRSGGTIDRYFCSRCGTRTFDHATNADIWFACAGTVEPNSSADNVLHVVSHMYVADTRDGGLASALQRLGERDIPSFRQRTNHDPAFTSRDLTALATDSGVVSEENKLLVSCKCASVQFYILRPQAAGNSISNPSVSRWLRGNGTKYLALNCACRYCRLAFGFSIASNTYVMPENIVSVGASAKPLFDYTSCDERTTDFGPSTKSLQADFPALRFDFSSQGIRRSFCGTCGASVFFERASRPQCVNIAVGLLRADSGALASDWIEFSWEVWWKNLAVDRDIVAALEAKR